VANGPNIFQMLLVDLLIDLLICLVFQSLLTTRSQECRWPAFFSTLNVLSTYARVSFHNTKISNMLVGS